MPGVAAARLITAFTSDASPFEQPADGAGLLSGHGVAVLEILSAIVPRARFYLIKVDDPVGCAKALDWARRRGVHIIHNSYLQWTNSWGDGTGTLAEAVARASDAGSLVVIPAGNAGQGMYAATFSSAGDSHHGWHDWNATDLPVVEQPFGPFNRLKPSHGLYHYRNDDRSVNPIGVRFPGSEIKLYLKWPPGDAHADLEAVLVSFDLNQGRWREAIGPGQVSVRAGQRSVSVLRYRVPADGLGIYGLRVRQPGGARTAFQVYLDDPDGLAIYTPAHSLAVPADAAGARVVGASRTTTWPRLDVPPYSARGPTKSGLAKPDLLGPSAVHLESVTANGGVLEGTCTASAVVAAIATAAWQRFGQRQGEGRRADRLRVLRRLLDGALEPASRSSLGASGLVDARRCLGLAT